MKKGIIIFLALLSISCSEELEEQIDALEVNPPSWIQGNWIVTEGTSGNQAWKFSPDAAFKIDEEGNEISVLLAATILSGLTGEKVTVDEFKNPTTYSITIRMETTDQIYRFSKISDSELSWDNAPPFNDPEHYLKAD